MPGDMVIIKAEIVEQFRKDRVLSRSGLYDNLSVHVDTGRKILSSKPVRLAVAWKVASAMGINVQNIIESWCD